MHQLFPLIGEVTISILASYSLQMVRETRSVGQRGNTTANVAVCSNGMLILRPIESLSQFFPMNSEILLVEDMNDVVTLERPNYMPLPHIYQTEIYLSKISRYDRANPYQSGHPWL